MFVIPGEARNLSVGSIQEEERFLVAWPAKGGLLGISLLASSSTVAEFSPVFNSLLIAQ
jgi:hypothetical protein